MRVLARMFSPSSITFLDGAGTAFSVESSDLLAVTCDVLTADCDGDGEIVMLSFSWLNLNDFFAF